jgi:hypothetical protein
MRKKKGCCNYSNNGKVIIDSKEAAYRRLTSHINFKKDEKNENTQKNDNAIKYNNK